MFLRILKNMIKSIYFLPTDMIYKPPKDWSKEKHKWGGGIDKGVKLENWGDGKAGFRVLNPSDRPLGGASIEGRGEVMIIDKEEG